LQTAYFDSLKLLFVTHWAVRGYFSDSLLVRWKQNNREHVVDGGKNLGEILEG
jgi:hypothetical protein